MAFSAQTDHGQCEQKDAVLCRIGKETSKEKAKVCTNSVDFSVALIRVLCAIYMYAKLEEKRLNYSCSVLF